VRQCKPTLASRHPTIATAVCRTYTGIPAPSAGRFQSYAIGNILSAQFYAAALKGHPDIPQEIASGEFGTLHTWLHNNLYRHGSKFAPNDLVKRATGKAMTIRPYLGYLAKNTARFIGCPRARKSPIAHFASPA
jgi:carboxypeptidase Taq